MATFRLGAIATSWVAAVILYSWVNGGERELVLPADVSIYSVHGLAVSNVKNICGVSQIVLSQNSRR
jgi:hypothetical protein